MLRSLMVKESREESRTFITNFFALACLCIAQQYLVLSKYKEIFNSIGNKDITYMTQMINMSLLSLAIICITFMSNATMSRSIQKEKKNGSIIIMVCLGLKPKHIWICKTILSYITGYISYILILIIDFAMQKIIFRLPTVISLKNIGTLFILGPLVACSLVLILSFLFWYFTNNAMVTLVYTMALTFGLWILTTIISSPINYDSVFVICVAVIVPIILYYILSIVIDKQEKWKLTSS